MNLLFLGETKIASLPGVIGGVIPITQGKNESANFRFLQRLSVIFGIRRDCRDLLLPAETVMLG